MGSFGTSRIRHRGLDPVGTDPCIPTDRPSLGVVSIFLTIGRKQETKTDKASCLRQKRPFLLANLKVLMFHRSETKEGFYIHGGNGSRSQCNSGVHFVI